MTEYEFLLGLINKLAASNANFPVDNLEALENHLNKAHEDGLLDEDRDYAPDAVMYYDWGLTPPFLDK